VALGKAVAEFEAWDFKVYYIWLAGTAEEYRQFHLMRRLFEEVATVAEASGYGVLALKTREDRFKTMFDWLKRTEWISYDAGDGWTVFFKIL